MPTSKTAPFFLYGIDPKNHALTNTTAGEWVTDRDFLRKYSGDIKIDSLNDPTVSHSVPSVFTRAIQFYNALKNTDNPLHKVITSEWRGLLAAIGLRTELGFDLKIKPINISPDGRSEADGRFMKILEGQLPHPVDKWKKWWTIYSDDHLIGVTSFWSIVYTPADYQCPQFIPWQNNEKFIDPIDFYKHSRRSPAPEMTLLYKWVVNLIAEYHMNSRHWNMEDTFAIPIIRELESWKDDLVDHADTNKDVEIDLRGSSPTADDPYEYFLRDVKISFSGVSNGGWENDSDIILRVGRANVVKPLVFFRKGIDKYTRVYGTILGEQVDVSMLKSRQSTGWKTPAGINVPLPYIFPEEIFFPEKLYKIKQCEDNALVFGIGDAQKYATPLTKEFFEFFSLSDLHDDRTMLSLREDDAGVHVVLRVPLSRGIEEVEKIYSPDDIIDSVKVGGVPVLAFWPDFYAEDWRDNVAVFHTPHTQELLTVTPMLSGVNASSVSTIDKKVETRLWFTEQPVQGFTLNYREPGQSEVPAGMILRKELIPPDALSSNRRWTIAVDFGTSNTNVWVKDQSGNTSALICKQRSIVLTEPVDDRLYTALSNLYSTLDVKPHFPSLVVNKPNQVAILSARDDMSDYLPIFEQVLENLIVQIKQGKQMETNLKWGAGGASFKDEPLRAYLKGLLRYIVCEARAAGINEATMRWSYPLSLAATPRQAIKTFWDAESSQLFTSGLNLTVESVGIPESEAVAKYLANQGKLQMDAGSLSIGVDVGGGSTDIAFWCDNTNLDYLSLKLAGGDLILPMCGLPNWTKQLFHTLYPGFASSLIALMKGQEHLIVNHMLTAIAKDKGVSNPKDHPLAVALCNKLYRSDMPWQQACSAVYLFFCGLAFYLGLHARTLIKHLTRDEIIIFFGGLGSNLLAWISNDWSDIESCLQEAFLAGLNLDGQNNKSLNVSIASHMNANLGHRPKDEVALGMLHSCYDNAERSESNYTPKNKTIVGENGWSYKSNGAEIRWDEEQLSEKLIKAPLNFNNCYISTFLKNILPSHLEKHGLDSNGLQDLKLDQPGLVEQQLSNLNKEGITLPVFIIELKLLINKYFDKHKTSTG